MLMELTPWNQKKIHAKLSSKGVTPSTKVKGKENREKGGHHFLINIELSNLKNSNYNNLHMEAKATDLARKQTKVRKIIEIVKPILLFG